MARRKSRTLTEVELEFMQVVWNAREVTTEDVMKALGSQGRHLSDGSVRKMLSILVKKGYLSRRRLGRAFLYKAIVDEQEATRKMVKDLLKRAFDGKAALMVATLLQSRALSKKEIDEIKRLIASHKKEKAR